MKERVRNFLFKSRADEISSCMWEGLSGESVLDVGSGNGYLAKVIYDRMKNLDNNPKVECIDIREYHKVDLPFKLFDGNKILYEDKTFDVVTIVYALHYTDNQAGLLKEAIRVAKKRVLVIEDTYESKGELLWLNFLDLVINKIYHNARTPKLNFKTEEEWKKILSELDCECLSKRVNLGILSRLGVKKIYFNLDVRRPNV
tara:strand:+ start:1126 stop:1728 length:603 start_codon:yes stop_codon:yes gene_type:complete